MTHERCIVRVYRSFADFCNFTNKDYSHTSEVETCKIKLCYFGHSVVKTKLLCQNSLAP